MVTGLTLLLMPTPPLAPIVSEPPVPLLSGSPVLSHDLPFLVLTLQRRATPELLNDVVAALTRAFFVVLINRIIL